MEFFNANEWIYVGEAENMEVRLYQHLRKQSDQGKRIMLRNPTGFVFERIGGELARKVREQTLIAELDPVCNR